MKLSEVCIERPVLAWVFTLVVVMMGLVGFHRLPVQKMPTIENVFLTIETQMPGVGPDIVESQITRHIEDAVSGIEGIETISSVSSSEDSKVYIEFRPGRSMDNAVNDVRDRLSRCKEKLPQANLRTEPMIIRSKTDDRPILALALTSSKSPPAELYDYAENEVKKDLESIEGVARVDISGASAYVMKIDVDPIRMAGYKINVEDVREAVELQNFEAPAGRIESKSRQYNVTTIADLTKPQDFDDVVIRSDKGRIIRIKDIGSAYVNADDKRTRTRFNGEQGVQIAITKQSNANPLKVAMDVKEALAGIQKRLPAATKIDIAADTTKSIEKSIKSVYWSIIEASVLVVLVVFLFLRSARASLIPLITIPVSIIGVAFLMYVLGYTLNMFTLFAMVLAVGLVVDDAIVVLENIHRHMEEGLSATKAAIKGVREIGFSVIAMTLTLVAVYLPIPLGSGKLAKYFTEFAITLAGSVLISGFVALTLSPMMCARLLKITVHDKERNKKGLKAEPDEGVGLDKEAGPAFGGQTSPAIVGQGAENTLGFTHDGIATDTVAVAAEGTMGWHRLMGNLRTGMMWQHFKENLRTDILLDKAEAFYEKQLRNALNRRLMVLGIAAFVALLGVWVLTFLRSEYAPDEDTRSIRVEANAPASATLEYTERHLKDIDAILQEYPEIERRISSINNPTVDISLELVEEPSSLVDQFLAFFKKKIRSTEELMAELKKRFSTVTGFDARIRTGGTSDANVVECVVRGNTGQHELKSMVLNLLQGMYKTNMVSAVRVASNQDNEDYIITMHRDKIASINKTPMELSKMIRYLLKGDKLNSKYKRDNKQYEINLQVSSEFKESPDDILRLFVRGGTPKEPLLIPLSELISLESRTSPHEIHRYNRTRSAVVLAILKPGRTVGEAVTAFEGIAKEILPEGSRLEFTGETRRYLTERQSMILVFTLAMCFIYLVMAAQFESWRDPFIIFLSVPLSLVGGLFALAQLDKGTLNMYSFIGFVTLIGLITKHGILIVDFANRLRESASLSIEAAVLQASRMRLRPILMTTFAMVLGAVPLMFGGAGNESRRQLGSVIIGGMSLGTVFTLFVVPVVYTYLTSSKRGKQNKAVADKQLACAPSHI